jgi:ppGpp synthetase/RelA/SpoT-type nucleotidyltranferase
MSGLDPAALADEIGVDEMEWVAPEYRRDKVNIAGRALVAAMHADWDDWDNSEWSTYETHLNIINNWRASHAYPLLVMRTTLGNYAKTIDQGALVAQRIKRLVSIGTKLDREPRMKLTQMQDIGGCRAVVATAAHLKELVEKYAQSSIKHKRATIDDYVQKPRRSGYRGIHIVYRYHSDKLAKQAYEDLKIEMQLRSQYQHAWATAVETVGTFIGQALKSSMGPDRWLRFFQLMGSVIAIREGTPMVPETGCDSASLYDELNFQANSLSVSHTLARFSDALQTLPRSDKKSSKLYYHLLRLNARTSLTAS